MSSHHFVKEGQEPALFIFDPVPFTLAQELLQWAPSVIATDAALEHVISWGIKIDVVCAVEQNIDRVIPMLRDLQPVLLLPCRDAADSIRSCIDYLNEKHESQLTILTSDVDSLVHLLSASAQMHQLAILEEGIRWILVREKFVKWVPADRAFRLKPISKNKVHHEGVLEKDNRFFSLAEGLVTFYSPGTFWLGEEF